MTNFVPILNLSVGFGGFCRWAANIAENEIIEISGGRISKRVNRALTTMFVENEPFVADIRAQEIRGAFIHFGRYEDGTLGFQSSVIERENAPEELRRRIRTAFFYWDSHGVLCAEGDLVLIEAEIRAMQNEEPVLPDPRGLIWPTQEHVHPGA